MSSLNGGILSGNLLLVSTDLLPSTTTLLSITLILEMEVGQYHPGSPSIQAFYFITNKYLTLL